MVRRRPEVYPAWRTRRALRERPFRIQFAVDMEIDDREVNWLLGYFAHALSDFEESKAWMNDSFMHRFEYLFREYVNKPYSEGGIMPKRTGRLIESLRIKGDYEEGPVKVRVRKQEWNDIRTRLVERDTITYKVSVRWDAPYFNAVDTGTGLWGPSKNWKFYRFIPFGLAKHYERAEMSRKVGAVKGGKVKKVKGKPIVVGGRPIAGLERVGPMKMSKFEREALKNSFIKAGYKPKEAKELVDKLNIGGKLGGYYWYGKRITRWVLKDIVKNKIEPERRMKGLVVGKRKSKATPLQKAGLWPGFPGYNIIEKATDKMNYILRRMVKEFAFWTDAIRVSPGGGFKKKYRRFNIGEIRETDIW